MNVALISTYELGRQPFGVASPAAWLKQAGAQVTCFDLAIDHLDDTVIRAAHLVAIYVPMHTATRLAIPVARRITQINPGTHLCFYGLYAPVNEKFLRALGADSIIGGEFEAALVALYKRLELASLELPRGGALEHASAPALNQSKFTEKFALAQLEPVVSLDRQKFLLPDRAGLPGPSHYARLVRDGSTLATGYTEASRGCKHLCRHCPIVPVYQGQFRVVQKEIVLADIRQQVELGAQHITLGDPDFFNGIGHALPIVQELHRELPHITYDVTIKIEHLLKHADALPILRETGCVFVTSAVEAVDNHILEIFDKHHTREDFIRVVEIFRELGLLLQPTFVAFNPWISVVGYRDLLALTAELDLIDQVPSIQWAIRLLVPAGSRLLELPDTHAWLGPFDAEQLCYRWTHPDGRVDELQKTVLGIVQEGGGGQRSRREIFERVWQAAKVGPENFSLVSKPIPHLSEPWYC